MSSELKRYLSTSNVLNLLTTTNQFIKLCQQTQSVVRMILNLAKTYYLQVPRGCVSDLVFSGINPKQCQMNFFNSRLSQ